jgi:hypothetical protein
MIVEENKSGLYHVPLVDLHRHKVEYAERTFASSEQVIEWVKQNRGVVYQTFRRGELGKKVLPPVDLGSGGEINEMYSLDYGDVIVGDLITYNDIEGLTTPGMGYGSG